MKKSLFILSLIFAIILLASCQTKSPSSALISVSIIHDNKTDVFEVNPGLTVQQIITKENIPINSSDILVPGINEIITNSGSIKIVRVTEEFVVEDTVLPFESQTVKNESLPVGQTLLIQAGVNGIQSNTYRVVSEDGVEQSRTIVKTEISTPSQPEILMIGIQSPFKSVEIPGTLAYISSANAWIMESNTGNRSEIVNSGDLDGRIFTLSSDGKFLLYSRSASDKEKETINSLWVIDLTNSNSKPIPLNVLNVVNYAEWVPGKELTIAYSTVEWRNTAPGWQANNDLIVLSFDESGKALSSKTIIQTNTGGIYGWWGTTFAFSPDASEIAYSRPDSFGLINSKAGQFTPIKDFSPYDTQGDWAWVPEINWSQDHSILFSVIPEEDPLTNQIAFSLFAYVVSTQNLVQLQENTGMFTFPSASPANSNGRYVIAYLSATTPSQSDTSRYDLRVIDKDGSNMKKLYPEEGVQGLSPQLVVWSPTPVAGKSTLISFLAQGNIYFVDPTTGNIQQITGDGSVSKIDWK